MPSTGTLYIVSTPIGNLKDITLRALEILKSVDLIAAEDTRHTRILTVRHDIKTPLTSYFEHNKVTKGAYLIKLLMEGKNVALVSDAGTPGISDPGSHIIRLAIENGIRAEQIPGASAVITGLVLSGMPTDKFIFEGFLPSKPGSRKNRLKQFLTEKRTVIFYESPHRLVKMLQDIHDVFGDITVACMRELTKKFEEVRRQKASELIAHFTDNKPLGEFVICFNLRERPTKEHPV
ncbi:MAG: 16S rRNA (cytidine(1402)-2'-O)-methyltransferase [Candidatus Omnitrophica bacterium]|nr:16S rRNA (cytidine(1402)-2'-O)-methyltransferase [Candidatus Omnitrophota bacterium]